MAHQVVLRIVEKTDIIPVKLLIDELENTISDPVIFESIFQEYLAHANTFMYVVEHVVDGIIGFGSCKGQRLLHHQGLVFEIQEMIVSSSHQGQGYGRLLFQKIQEEVVVRGAISLEVTSNKRRKEAHAFYESMGFRNSHEKFTIYF